jgi:hypothetical protein
VQLVAIEDQCRQTTGRRSHGFAASQADVLLVKGFTKLVEVELSDDAPEGIGAR